MEAKPSFGYESQLQTDKVMTLSITISARRKAALHAAGRNVGTVSQSHAAPGRRKICDRPAKLLRHR